MRRFKFGLETALRHRETIETLCEQEFAARQQVLEAIRARLRQLREEFRATVAGRPGSKPGEMFDATGIVGRERYLETLQAAIAVQERREEGAQVVLAEKRAALVAARQAREAISRLRDRHLQEHNALVERLTQNALDELAVLRYTRASQSADTDLISPNDHHEAREAA